jgi:hypothetical protein
MSRHGVALRTSATGSAAIRVVLFLLLVLTVPFINALGAVSPYIAATSSTSPYIAGAAATPPASDRYPTTTAESVAWAKDNNLHRRHATTHSLFSKVATYLRSSSAAFGSRQSCAPFVIRKSPDMDAMVDFGTDELQAAIQNDFLDAGEGSTNAQKGWRMQPVGGNRRGTSFQQSRLEFQDVVNAKGTVIFNSAGAYISSILSTTSLAALDGLDGAVPGVCLNMYVTRGDAKVSAPPHTDKQDVMVVQTQGRKHWRVFSPPTSIKGNVGQQDPFSRGKGADDLPVELLESTGSKLLLEVTLNPGDLLFVPARFPHTTDTLSCYVDEPEKVFGLHDWSIHLTVGLDSHVWSMNYLSMRQLGLCRFNLHDPLVEDKNDDANYVGVANQKLSAELHEALFSSVDSCLLSRTNVPHDDGNAAVENVAINLFLLNEQVNHELLGVTNNRSSLTIIQCIEIATQFRDIGRNVLKTHRNMYQSAIAEERVRRSGSADRQDRLSLFRVPPFFEKLDCIRDELRTWADGSSTTGGLGAWAASQCILKGDQVEARTAADGWSPAKVMDARSDGMFDLQQFDGSIRKGVRREDLKGPHGIGIFI